MPLYPTPNETGIVGLMRFSNTVTNNIFGPLFLIVIFAIFFMSFKSRNQETPESLVSSFMGTSVSAIFLYIMNVVPDYAVLISIIMTGISMAVLYRANQ